MFRLDHFSIVKTILQEEIKRMWQILSLQFVILYYFVQKNHALVEIMGILQLYDLSVNF